MSASPDFETFGRWLSRRRKLLDLTQEQLGRLAGCSAAAIRKFEADLRRPSRQLAGLLAVALQIPPQEHEDFLKLARGLSSVTLPLSLYPISLPHRPIAQKASPPENLPAPLTSLVNRLNDLSTISALLVDSSVRWVSLVGPPGIGKTRLSIQAGRQVLEQFSDGIWFVDLAPLDDLTHVLPAVARALAPLGLPSASGFDQLASLLKERALLIILDNFEHLAGAAVEIATLLKRCAHLKVLVTSRIPLQVYGEHIYRVPPLSVPPRAGVSQPHALMGFEAVQLFVERARQHQPAFAITPQTAAAMVEIVNILDGIPLALELAAASLQRMTLAELRGLLHHLQGENWLRQVAAPARDLPVRQHTLENVVAWSFSLLTAPQQELFSRLAVFPGWFDTDAVAAVCYEAPRPDHSQVRQLLESLVNHSLLMKDSSGDLPRWRMLEIIHEYSSLQLDPPQRQRLEQRRAGYFLDCLHSLEREPDPSIRETFFQLHLANLQASLKWAIAGGHTGIGFELAGYLDDFWSSHGYFKEVLGLMKQLFALPGSIPPAERALRLESASDMAWQQHDFETSLAFIKEAIELRRSHGLPDLFAHDLNRLGRIYLERGEYTLARQALEECLAIARREPGSLNPAVPLAQLGELALFEGRLEQAKSALIEALSGLDDAEGIFQAVATVDLVEIALAQQDFPQARDRLWEAYGFARLHIRRTLVFLFAAAGYLILAPQKDKSAALTAASLFGAIDALGERSGVVFSPFYRRLGQARSQLARQRLLSSEWQAAYETGRQWGVETALSQIEIALD